MDVYTYYAYVVYNRVFLLVWSFVFVAYVYIRIVLRTLYGLNIPIAFSQLVVRIEKTC